MSSRILMAPEGTLEVHLEPFPYIVLDDWWPDDLLADVAGEFPEPDDPRWFRFDNERERKQQGGPPCWGPATRRLLALLGTAEWLTFVGRLMAIEEPLQMDTEGGGMHLIPPGGYLDIHADFNQASSGLWRRANCLVFLNRGWDEDDQGELELWSSVDGQAPLLASITAIPPVFNRTVIFETSDRSFHGHPLATGPEFWRRSIAAYYYSETRPEGASEPHSTVFLQR